MAENKIPLMGQTLYALGCSTRVVSCIHDRHNIHVHIKVNKPYRLALYRAFAQHDFDV